MTPNELPERSGDDVALVRSRLPHQAVSAVLTDEELTLFCARAKEMAALSRRWWVEVAIDMVLVAQVPETEWPR